MRTFASAILLAVVPTLLTFARAVQILDGIEQMLFSSKNEDKVSTRLNEVADPIDGRFP